jgi:hypothetical protein
VAADSLVKRLTGVSPASSDSMVAMRLRYLRSTLAAMAVRARMVSGDTLGFDDEARALYDVEVPQVATSSLEAALARIDSLVPGTGPLEERYVRYRAGFEIPPARLDTVFRACLAEVRRRTLAHVALPDSEWFEVQYVTGQPWGAYNWYQGGYHSLIQVNVDQPVSIDGVIGLASHEGYPGHHVLNVLIERELVRERGWSEFSLFPLYGPLAFIAEGSANVGPEVAFSGEERAAFMKSTLFPLAGLDPGRYDRYAAVGAALDSLELSGIENARRYLDRRIPRAEAVRNQMRFGLYDSTRAERRIRFVERYRSYIVNYGLGKRAVLSWMEANGAGRSAPADVRWRRFITLLSAPPLPSDLGSRPGR